MPKQSDQDQICVSSKEQTEENRIPVESTDHWEIIREKLIAHSDTLWLAYFAGREEALNQNDPFEYEKSKNPKFIGPDYVPYKKGVDYKNLQNMARTAKMQVDPLFHAIERREITPEFVLEYGFVCEVASMITALRWATGDEFFQERASRKAKESRSKADQRHWVALLLNDELGRGIPRKTAEVRVAGRIGRLVDENRIPSGFSREWFECILGKGGMLKSTYEQNAFSNGKVKDLAENRPDHLPPTDI